MNNRFTPENRLFCDIFLEALITYYFLCISVVFDILMYWIVIISVTFQFKVPLLLTYHVPTIIFYVCYNVFTKCQWNLTIWNLLSLISLIIISCISKMVTFFLSIDSSKSSCLLFIAEDNKKYLNIYCLVCISTFICWVIKQSLILSQ